MEIDEKVIAELIKGYEGPEDLIGENGLLKQLTKRLLQAAMGAELSVQLGQGCAAWFSSSSGPGGRTTLPVMPGGSHAGLPETHIELGGDDGRPRRCPGPGFVTYLIE